MNRNFLVDLTPRNARLLLSTVECCHVNLDPKIIMKSKEDLIPAEEYSALPRQLDQKQKQLVQFLVDHRLRATVPYDFDRDSALRAILSALIIMDEQNVILLGVDGMSHALKDLSKKYTIHDDSVDIDPAQEGWKYVSGYPEMELLIPLRNHVLLTSTIDPLLGKLFPKCIIFDKMSQQFMFNLNPSHGQSQAICSARQMAATLYPSVVASMPGSKLANFKRRGYSLFPLMGVFSQYLKTETK